MEIEKMNKCTICLEEGEEVKHFCKCDKEMGLYHKECLTRWVEESYKATCPFCKTIYDIEYNDGLSIYQKIDDDRGEQRINKNTVYVQICFLVFMVILLGGLILGNVGKHGAEWRTQQVTLFFCFYWFVGFWILKLSASLPVR